MTSITAGIAYISEAAAKDSFVALISTSDRDSGANGQVHCALYGHDHFKIQQAYEDSYMIVTTAPLDREKIAEYNLTVVAEDLGSPPFRTITQYTIRLNDENDNVPLFSKPVYEVSVVENNAPGAYITTVVARDLDLGHNGKVIYRLSDTQIMDSPASTFQKKSGDFQDEVDIPHLERAKNNCDPLISSHSAEVFDVRPYASFPHSHTAGSNLGEDGSVTTCVYSPENRIRGAKYEGYSTLPGYGKEAVRPITIWKGNSYTTISARDPQFSGKDSGKGDSDFNDSDSDISGDGIKKDCPPPDLQSGLWACTSECKILGHSDRCWSPSAVRPNASSAHGQNLSPFDKTASLPRDTLRRDNYYQAHIPKTIGLQSVYEKVLHNEHDYVLVSTPRPVRAQEMNEIAIPVYAPNTPRCHANHV
ncbi:hypothetical protein MATL_G00179950 [Megalops atlanticus]|uniref:Cadherin domain-containing protein n=1 Tax=Megalops atlanticus TaxID=7932 RepID=A0A9D3PRD2_MEGAT|nr:hypothetical protein MATL_G00179950 [Megalops atlanticus]